LQDLGEEALSPIVFKDPRGIHRRGGGRGGEETDEDKEEGEEEGREEKGLAVFPQESGLLVTETVGEKDPQSHLDDLDLLETRTQRRRLSVQRRRARKVHFGFFYCCGMVLLLLVRKKVLCCC
jgi:hypothetical protein